MSFILDALKKSEAERQRQSGPTLLEVRITPPRRRYPLWALIVGALLALNVVILLLFLLRRPAPPGAAVIALPVAAPAAAAPAVQVAPAAAAPETVAAPPVSAPLQATPSAPPATLPASPVATDASANEAGADNPADDAPAVPRGHVTRNDQDYASLPSSADFGNLPDLRLDLHVYAERPTDRYALINMHRVREGDTLPEGPKVLAITREGVALDFQGQDFMLRPQ